MSQAQTAVPNTAHQCLIDGWPINVGSQSEAVDRTIALAAAGVSFSVFTLNLDHLVQLRRDAIFREAYRQATLVTADGAPVVAMGRLLGHHLERVTGADLVVPLASAAAAANMPIFLFGTSAEVIGRAGQELVDRTDGQLSIAGSEAPARNFDPTGPEARAALERIRASGARLCFVALGAPKQERFAAFAHALGVPVGFVCIGAGLDFLAGKQIRAPQFFQDWGLEWAWRLAQEPRRLAVRYARCAALLARLLVSIPFRTRTSGVET